MPSSADETSERAATPGLTPASLKVIRFMLLAGSASIGAIAWYLTSSGQVIPTLGDETASLMRYVFYGIVAAHLVGMALVRQRTDRAETFVQRARLLIVGYALADGLVIYGAVYLFLTGNAALFLGGLIVFLVAFVMLPVQPASAR